jgi:hypothetical protein
MLAVATVFAAGLVLASPAPGRADEAGQQALIKAIDQVANLVAQNPGIRGRNLDMALLHLVKDLVRLEEHHRHHHHHHYGFGRGMANILNAGNQPALAAGQHTGRHVAGGHKHEAQRVGQQVAVGRKGGCAGALAGHHKHHGGFGNGVVIVAGNLGGANKGKAQAVRGGVNNNVVAAKGAKGVALAGRTGAGAGKGKGKGKGGNK